MSGKIKAAFVVLVCLLLTGGSVFFILRNRNQDGKVTLKYELTLKGEHRVHVKLVYLPVESDSTIFIYGEPMFGGQNDIIKCLVAVKAQPPAKIKANWSKRKLTVYYSRKNPVTIEYDIIDAGRKEDDVKGELFRPVIQKGYFYCHGINLFLRPLFRNADKKIIQSVVWSKKPVFPVFCSIDPQERGIKPVAGKPADFMFTLFTGAADLTVEEKSIGNSPGYLVLNGGQQSKSNQNDIREYYTKYYKNIRRFWNDKDSAVFTFVMQPFINSDQNIGGMAFDNGFAVKYSKGKGKILSSDRIFTISHEIGHRWIGGTGINAGIQNQWFTEGFNDYITYYVLAASKMITDEEFEKEFNRRTMAVHYLSSVKNVPNDEVLKNYWKLGESNRLPYRRGCIFAFYLDNQIYIASKGKNDIRDFLVSLYRFSKTKGEGYVIKTDDFINVLSGYLPRNQIEKAFKSYILSGDVIPVSGKMLVHGFSINYIMGIPYLNITDKKAFSQKYSLK